MALIHEDRRTVSFKIVYCGTPIGGKTTNLQHIHACLDPTSRGELVSLSTAADRTLFFDFLAVEAPLADGYTAKFQLYTVPGQIIYNATYQLVMQQADGFVYCVSSLGVTGVRSSITTDISEMVSLVKAQKNIPCAVGFGISTPEQASKMAAQADGVIVGSAIVRLCAQYGDKCVPYVADYVRSMKAACLD